MAHRWLMRMSAVVLLAVSVLAPAPARVHGESEGWIRQFGTMEADQAEGVAVDPEGNVLVAGWTLGTMAGQQSSGMVDVFVRKYDPAGNELWTRQFGAWEKDFAHAISVDGAGNAYVVGETHGILPGQSSGGGFDAFVRKYDPAGNELWTRQMGGGGGDAAWGVAVEPDGAVYLAGSAGGALPGQASIGAFDAFVRKYDAAGNPLWTRQFGTTASDAARGVALDPAGQLVVAGHTDGELPGQSRTGKFDAFVRQYDPQGNENWTRQFGTFEDDLGVAVGVDRMGKASVVGTTDDVLPDQAQAGSTDVYLRGYDRAGGLRWTRQFGTKGIDDGMGIAVDEGLNQYVTGNTDGTLPEQTSAGKGDIFVRRYDSQGEIFWTVQFGSPDWDGAGGIAVDRAGAIYVVGAAGGALAGQVSAGQRDAFLVKLIQ
jgi:hypothetical protein